MEITLGWKIIIFLIILVIAYFVLRYYEMDPFVILWESFSEIEFNILALALTLVFSMLIWLIIWKNPLWVNSTAYGLKSKIFLTLATPIVGYPLAVRALNKD